MSFETDQRLRSYLDSNQLSRERLCLAVLALDKRFSNVRPRHPRGGPDGGIDIDATFKDQQIAAAAVGFVNGANDSKEQKKAITAKFEKDARSAFESSPKPSVFAFFTNIDLTVGEANSLKATARNMGFADCDIFYRERIRVALDSVDGFASRIQYLGIPLSDAEQASFFAKWGDDIQSVIATSFQRVERKLDRMLFLQESEFTLDSLTIIYELDRLYTADEIGHFRAFCSLLLHEPKYHIWQIFFGCADGGRTLDEVPSNTIEHGASSGISSAAWEQHVDWRGSPKKKGKKTESESEEKWKRVGGSNSVGMSEIAAILADYQHDTSFIRFEPRMILRDINGCSFIHYLNATLAAKVKAIHVVANGYKLAEFGPERISIDTSPFEHEIPPKFSSSDLSDPWVRIRDKTSSTHSLDFAEWTPKRMLISRETPHTTISGRNKFNYHREEKT